ncbi:MAG TPA: DALR domain-containing protein, partial [Actinomycetota bacterium]|nr:DALR domain-containing protein [Actinomycetota bacterium]
RRAYRAPSEQAASLGLRPVEERTRRRALVGFAMGAGAAGLAYRVLGHVYALSRDGVRHPWWGNGLGLSASRERDRASRGFGRRSSLVRHWVHSGMVQMEQEKMSKSLGNFVLAKDVVEIYPPEVIRYWALMSSYRSQPTFSEAALDDAAQAYDRWRNFVVAAEHALGGPVAAESQPRRPIDDDRELDPYLGRFIEAMDDDFNSAEAFAALHELVREGNKHIEGAQEKRGEDADALGRLLGVFVETTTVLGLRFPRGDVAELTRHLLDFLLELREQARAEKAFDRADSIRQRLADAGVVIEDTASGPRWYLEESSGAANETEG